MYVCYIDESGHCGAKYDPKQPVEVVSGVITDITKIFKTQREHNLILSILKNMKIEIKELKAKEIYGGRNNWKGVKPIVRKKIMDALLKWANDRSCKFIVCPIDSKTFFEKKNNSCEFSNNFNSPYEAGILNVILSVQRLKNGIKKNKGKTLIIVDEQKGHDNNIIRILDSDLTFTDKFTGYKNKPRSKTQELRLNEIIDIPFFSKSHISTLIQIADIAAFIVNKYISLTCYDEAEKYAGETDVITDWYKKIGAGLIPHLNINPQLDDPLCNYYRELRPIGWNPKDWTTIKN